MKCKNPYCNWTNFVPVIELDNNTLKREGWNSVKWGIKKFGEG